MKLKKALFGFVSRDTPTEERLKAARREVELDPPDLVTVLYLLSFDADEEVSRAAKDTLGGLGAGTLASAMDADLEPPVAKKAAELHKAREEEVSAGPDGDAENQTLRQRPDEENPTEGQLGGPEEDGIDTSFSQEAEEALPLVQQIRNMTVSEKIKLAITADKEIRGILIKDSNKQISKSVLANPRTTEDEVVKLTATRGTPEELLRLIAKNKEWMKNYRIISTLAQNPKTPVNISLRVVPLLHEKDLARMSISKNIPNVIASSAKKNLELKRKHR